MTPDINSQDWQQNFISTNLIAIGYNAWLGYLNGERGIVICSTNSPDLGVCGETFKVPPGFSPKSCTFSQCLVISTRYHTLTKTLHERSYS